MYGNVLSVLYRGPKVKEINSTVSTNNKKDCKKKYSEYKQIQASTNANTNKYKYKYSEQKQQKRNTTSTTSIGLCFKATKHCKQEERCKTNSAERDTQAAGKLYFHYFKRGGSG